MMEAHCGRRRRRGKEDLQSLVRIRTGHLEGVSRTVPGPQSRLSPGCLLTRLSDSDPMGGGGPQEARDQHPSADLSPHTRSPRGALPAESSEVVHGLGEGGDRRESGRALRGPQEAVSSQPQAREVVRALRAPAHAGGAESGARCGGVRLQQLHRGTPTHAGHSWPGPGGARVWGGGGGEGGRKTGPERGRRGRRGKRGGVEGWRGAGISHPCGKPLPPLPPLLLIYSKNNSGRAAGRRQSGRGLEEGGPEGGTRAGKARRRDPPGPLGFRLRWKRRNWGSSQAPPPAPHPGVPGPEHPGFPGPVSRDVVWSDPERSGPQGEPREGPPRLDVI